MIREQERKVSSGYLMLVVILVLQLATFYWVFDAIRAAQSVPMVISGIIALLIVAILWAGFFMVHPNQARVLQLFGEDLRRRSGLPTRLQLRSGDRCLRRYPTRTRSSLGKPVLHQEGRFDAGQEFRKRQAEGE